MTQKQGIYSFNIGQNDNQLQHKYKELKTLSW